MTFCRDKEEETGLVYGLLHIFRSFNYHIKSL